MHKIGAATQSHHIRMGKPYWFRVRPNKREKKEKITMDLINQYQ